MIPFATAKEEAMEFIHRGEDKPGCAEKDVDSIIGECVCICVYVCEREIERKERERGVFVGEGEK